ncbi:3-deoxy-manno-octulosonate cytidylyltransferase [Hydromonas duriensis]|uniref:3-deoxy-manno-octulosonate cytidylyltransferase n=1 Tax=Hydromonas duriensis TaxID=1527608 RepID=A0A4R6YBH9_9BURK|nr:3-deoxy-manno-octulosonate cytidylyltransferase [Hydromonas duriensis]TDR32992.1 3-deoxy-manno-octulosonate cytidylyltransferase (CMP-KDO synthetase) [Hydromonas duriensis]
MNAPFKVVIPARMGSSRFYGKPLIDIAGRTMVLRVVEQALASGAQSVVVATDHPDIFNCVTQAGYVAHMTDAQHPSGTDRIAQVALDLGWADDAIVVNVQGDEPAIAPNLIAAVAVSLHDSTDSVMSTAAHPLHSAEDFLNPNIVKVVLDNAQHALYFSRAPIPYPRDAMRAAGGELSVLPAQLPVLRHMGIYAYRVGFLKRYGQLPVSVLEQNESLEQLRVLANGERICVHVSDSPAAPGVDEPTDVALVEAYLRKSATESGLT